MILNGPIDYYGGYAWYEPLQSLLNRAWRAPLAKLDNLLQELLKQGFEYEDIFISGFSQGGCLSLELLYKTKEKLGGIIALSPKMFPLKPDFSPNKSQKRNTSFVSHGLYDEVIPYSEVEKRCKELEERGLNPFKKSYSMGHEIDFDEIEDLRSWINDYL